MLAGLESFNKGDINIGNLKENHLSMILQDNNLLPWLNTYQNIEFAVKANKFNIDKRDIDKILTEYELLEFSKNFPYQMSVGMKQKVSFAKAMITNPDLVLLDEPFCALDYISKENMHQLFLDEYIKRRLDRKSTRLNSSHRCTSRMPSSA